MLALDATLGALGVCRHLLPRSGARHEPVSGLTRFAVLQRLTLTQCWPRDSIAPLATHTELVSLRSARLGWRRSAPASKKSGCVTAELIH